MWATAQGQLPIGTMNSAGGVSPIPPNCLAVRLLPDAKDKDLVRALVNQALIAQSSLDWEIVRPPRLKNGPHTARYRSGESIEARRMGASVSRADVADFMLTQIVSDTYVHRTPAVMY